MFSLIRNEFKKLFSRFKTYVIIILFITFIIINAVISYGDKGNQLNLSESERIESINIGIKYTEKQIKSYEESEETYDGGFGETVESEIELLNKKLEEYKELLENKNYKYYWKPQLKYKIAQEEYSVKALEKSDLTVKENKDQLDKVRRELELDKIILSNNLEPLDSPVGYFEAYSFTFDLIESLGMILLIIIISAFISDIVSGEYSPGTVKFLLVQPIKRWQVLFAKFITSIVTTLAMVLSGELIVFYVIKLITKVDYGKYPVVLGQLYEKITSSEAVKSVSPILTSGYISNYKDLLLKSLGLQSLFIIALISVLFLISIISNNSATSMAISIAGLGVVAILIRAVPSLLEIGKYMFISYGESNAILTGKIAENYGNCHLTTNLGIAVLIGTIIIFSSLSCIVFKKKEIK